MEVINSIRTGVEKIDRLPAPVTLQVQPPVVQGIQIPVVDVPVPRLDYPRIELPRQENFNQGVPSKPQEQEQEKPEKTRELPVSPPVKSPVQVLTPPVEPVVPTVPLTSKSSDTVEVQIAGHTLDLPSPTAVVQASATAIIGTSATLVTALVFNQVRQAATPVAQKLVRDKFKIKLKSVKPVLHFIEKNGEVHVIEYSAEGVKLLSSSIDNPEQYLRDLIDIDPLFESDHRIVIDEPIKAKFTNEGAARFKYFMSPKKLAKKLSARFAI